MIAKEGTSYQKELEKQPDPVSSIMSSQSHTKSVSTTGVCAGHVFGDITNCSIGHISVYVNPSMKTTEDVENFKTCCCEDHKLLFSIDILCCC